ncbi:GNAT family N-acetyltransferase [Acidisoma silvae]|uniref:GNAT family N-acetyltransferase n=1 Tax=Acidisoma silvae TaxID=2802396 RepID=A0A963YQR1_9PROT|nr:GNAT family N-acetyltransferase [Acidisoma silvae]MCB8875396.1 GNAT family N-acetyltransferase [Acidisoma silvae]
MTTHTTPLPPGYSPLPPGHLANIVTFLEMGAKPDPLPAALFPPEVTLTSFDPADLAGYRALFRRVGDPWLWFSQAALPDAELAALLADPQIESFALRQDGEAIGILQLDFREAEACELLFFGLAPGFTAKGLGGALMRAAIARAWAKPISRFWLHTCSFDSPAALGFYQRMGFTPYAMQVEVHTDPRLTGDLPEDAAPQIPLIRPRSP